MWEITAGVMMFVGWLYVLALTKVINLAGHYRRKYLRKFLLIFGWAHIGYLVGVLVYGAKYGDSLWPGFLACMIVTPIGLITILMYYLACKVQIYR